MDTHDLSVVILNHNGRTILPACLEALGQTVPAAPDCELLLIDNGSTDGSGKIGEAYGARVISADNEYGFITGLNAAFANARRPWVLFLQNDVYFQPDTLQHLWDAAEYVSPLSILQPTLINSDGTLNHGGGRYLWPGYGLGNRKFPQTEGLVSTIDLFSTACFMMSQKVYKLVGPFDESFAPAYYEDVDYSLRATQLGIPRYIVPQAVARHLSTSTFHQQYTKRELSEICRKNRHRIVEKHMQEWRRILRHSALQFIDSLRVDRGHGDTYRRSP